MSRHLELYHWRAELAKRFPKLRPSVVLLLALWSLGMILVRRAGLVAVTRQLMPLLGQNFHTVRQRLREFYQEASAKAGAKRGIKRQDFAVADCFAPLLAWILSYWSQRRLALALDVTNLGDRLHILCVSVLFGGMGLPVAWKILPGNQKEAWHPHWCTLLQGLRGALGDTWQVVVLTDRGLESSRLFEAIVALGWHPLMRVKRAAKFRPQGWVRWYALSALVPRVGARFAARGVAYKTAPLNCTLLACWQAPHQDAWLLLTDLPPGAAEPCWYAWRAWIEQGFKAIKSAGLRWEQTRMENPERLERQWLVLAVTVLWLVAIGAEVERQEAVETVGELPTASPRSAAAAPRPRVQRLLHIGWAVLVAALVQQRPLPTACLTELTWPQPHEPPTLSEEQFLSGQTYS
jgi:hypothetical protein